MSDNDHRSEVLSEPERVQERIQERDKILEAVNIPGLSKVTKDNLDLSLLVDSPDHKFPGTVKDASNEVKNTWIIKAMSAFGEAKGKVLHEIMKEDFEEWTADDFEGCNTLILRALKVHLERHELSLPPAERNRTTLRLEKLIKSELMDEAPKFVEATGRASLWSEEQQPTPRPGSPPKHQTRFPVIPQGSNDRRSQPSRFPSPQFPPPPNEFDHQAAFLRSTADAQPQFHQAQFHRVPSPQPLAGDDIAPGFYHVLPPQHADNLPIDGAQLKQFASLWNKENNYSGETYDILDDKMRIFTDTCELLRIKYRQLHALFPSILKGRAQHFFLQHMTRSMQYREMYLAIKAQFDSEINRAQYHTDWSSMSFYSVASEAENAGKTKMEVLEILLDRIQRCQRALGPAFSGDVHLMSATLRAVQGVPELKIALARPESNFNALSAQLKSTLQVEENSRTPGHFLTDRRYEGNTSYQRRAPERGRADRSPRPYAQRERSARGQDGERVRKCWICGKADCWSSKHPEDERKRSRENWMRQQKARGLPSTGYRRFLMSVENCSSDEDSDDQQDAEFYSDELESFENENTAFFLANESFRHRMNGQQSERASEDGTVVPAERVFLQHKLNSAAVWYGIIPDTGAAEVSTAGRLQVDALRAQMPWLQVAHGKGSRVRFGAGEPLMTTEEITVPTPFGKVTFHIVPTDTPFLMCIKAMDELGVYLDNTRNELVRGDGKRVQVIRKWGHPWFFLDSETHFTAGITYIVDPGSEGASFLSETELRRIHKRFGHPSVEKLWKLLKRADHDVDRDALELINRFCHYCQLKGTAPQRFKFSLKDDADFNYEIIVDVASIASKPVLHVVDASTGFQAASFLSDFSARGTWETLKRCWLDTYLGPPDVVTVDAGTNFASAEFKAEARLAGITCHQIPVEAHWSIGKIERFHRPLRRAFEILKAECPEMSDEAALQGAVKAVNDTAGPDGLVPTLLVFGAMPKITRNSVPTASQVKRAEAVNKAMNELRKIVAQRKVNDAVNTRNGPDAEAMLPRSLKLGSEVLVYREKDGWTGPFNVLAVTDTSVTVEMVNGPTEFRSTHTKPYERLVEQRSEDPLVEVPEPFEYPEPILPRRRGRPRAQEPSTEERTQEEPRQMEVPVKRGRGRPRKQAASVTEPTSSEAQFLVRKEQQSYELALQLRSEGKITTAGKPFEQSDWEEIESLLAAGVLLPIKRSQFPGARTFGCRMVREVKGLPKAPYEKSRLVVQGHSDWEKASLLTQAPTIMRCSQRLILAIAPSLQKKGYQLMLRDISQAYTQSATELQRDILLRIPKELQARYPDDVVFQVIKPLYGIAEAGLHWFATYQKHHRDQLNCIPSSYDPCLLLSKEGSSFGLVGMQTDDTLNLGEPDFIAKEQDKLVEAGFKAKPAQILNAGGEGIFNGCIFTVEESNIVVRQKDQASRLERVDKSSQSANEQYIAQRARGAYIASICQPEAAYDYSVAAQTREPEPEDIDNLNKRIQWQIDNASRPLCYVPLDLSSTVLYAFVDGSFANNKDLSSQIGFVIVLGNERANEQEKSFELSGNIIHWQSVKCKRVTRSVLASEIYGMVSGFDAGFVLKQMLVEITKRLNLPPTKMVMCTDSFSLYQCLVQLGTTAEKRLMIDVMALRQSYEERELDEIRWIAGGDNPADSMTKRAPNGALEKLVSTNQLVVRVEGWVNRSEKKSEGGQLSL